tara:strand:- start:835 stop:975 length:141 start_codon:yes stop_codon:yes gene_type:complete
MTIKEMRKQEIKKALLIFKTKKKTAKALGITTRTIYNFLNDSENYE